MVFGDGRPIQRCHLNFTKRNHRKSHNILCAQYTKSRRQTCPKRGDSTPTVDPATGPGGAASAFLCISSFKIASGFGHFMPCFLVRLTVGFDQTHRSTSLSATDLHNIKTNRMLRQLTAWPIEHLMLMILTWLVFLHCRVWVEAKTVTACQEHGYTQRLKGGRRRPGMRIDSV